MTIPDYINAGLLFTAVLGIALTYWQVRSSAKTQRASFLKDLYLAITSDVGICEAYYKIEYGKFVYDKNFHGSDLEPKLDRLLAFADVICEMHDQGVISEREMKFFEYRFRRLGADADVNGYLDFLRQFYGAVGTGTKPFHRFVGYAQTLLERDA